MKKNLYYRIVLYFIFQCYILYFKEYYVLCILHYFILFYLNDAERKTTPVLEENTTLEVFNKSFNGN